MTGTKSPLRARPRRVPGQSVDEHLHDQAFDKVLSPFLAAIFLIVLAVVEWIRYVQPTPPNPWPATALAALGLAYAVVKISQGMPKLRALRLARDGERAVAEVLEGLRENGYKVFHDVLGDGFNVDHVLIGPTGVYTVETKTYSKPIRGEAIIHFDGASVTVGRLRPDRSVISQARAQASWLRGLIRDSTSFDTPVRSVVVYPGWYIEKNAGVRSDVWVLNPKALRSFLEKEAVSLDKERYQMFAFHLSRYARRAESA